MIFDLWAIVILGGLCVTLFIAAWFLDRVHERQTRRRRYVRRVQ